jgi:hypothetical protein
MTYAALHRGAFCFYRICGTIISEDSFISFAKILCNFDTLQLRLKIKDKRHASAGSAGNGKDKRHEADRVKISIFSEKPPPLCEAERGSGGEFMRIYRKELGVRYTDGKEIKKTSERDINTGYS